MLQIHWYLSWTHGGTHYWRSSHWSGSMLFGSLVIYYYYKLIYSQNSWQTLAGKEEKNGSMCIWKMWPEILCGGLGASPSSWLGSYSLVALPDICLLVQTYSSPLTIQRSNTMRSGRLVLCLSKTCCCILLLALIAPFKFPPIALKEEKAQKLTSKTMYVQDCFVSCNKEKNG